MPGPNKGQGGRPPKPVEQKRRTGRGSNTDAGGRKLKTTQSDQTVEPAEEDQTESTPAEIASEVLKQGAYWIGETDGPTVALLRETLEERASLRDSINAAESPQEVDPKQRSALRDLDKQVIQLLSSLGLDPTSRSKLGLAEVKAQSKMDQLKANRKNN